MKIQYYRLSEDQGGGISIFPSESEVEANYKLFAKTDQKSADFYKAQIEDAKAIAGKDLITEDYPFKTVTRLMQLDAKRHATTSKEEGEFDYDEEAFWDNLISTALGITVEALQSKDLAIFNKLRREVESRISIDPARLSFFATLPTASPQANP